MDLLTLTFDLFNPKTMSSLGYSKVISCTKSEHFGIIRFRVMLRTNRQTNTKQTEANILPTSTNNMKISREPQYGESRYSGAIQRQPLHSLVLCKSYYALHKTCYVLSRILKVVADDTGF